ncbi:MAG TPA: GIY-YIG nuclease family protein [Nostocaceae cyanobacterium]|nr:GIY-YIG nuclease family protein [Nostocaceae cyanobacterium]
MPKLPGVYLLYNLSNNGLYYPFYVGESNNLQRRLLDHLADYESVRRYRCGFRYALMPRSTKEMRRAAEAAIYYAHPDWFPYNDESKLSKNGTYIFDLGL